MRIRLEKPFKYVKAQINKWVYYIYMDTNKRDFLTAVIKQWYTFSQDELDNMSDFEIATLGSYTMQAVQVAHGKGRKVSCVIVMFIPVFVALSVIFTYCVR